MSFLKIKKLNLANRIGEGCHLITPAVLFLFFRHSAKSHNAQDEHLATSPKMVKRLHLPHAVVMRFHVRKINFVIFTPETVGTTDV